MTPRRHFVTSILTGLAIATLLGACTPATGGLGPLPSGATPDPSIPQGSPDLTPQPSGTPTTPSVTPPPTSGPGGTPLPTPTTAPSGTVVVRAYFVDENAESLIPVLRVVPETVAVARAAMLELLEGPSSDEDQVGIGSAVPDGTGLLGLSIAGGVATVDLTGQFASGGGATSTLYRLAQVVYTLTQFPTVDSVIFRIDGQEVEVFGSEGLVLGGPQARVDYEDQLPEIWVDRPAWGAALGNPGRVAGNAEVFEAQFMITLLDASGATLYEQPAMATCGGGCEPRGTFDVTIPYDVTSGQWGTLRVWYGSAQDGSPQGIREYPVWLTPGG